MNYIEEKKILSSDEIEFSPKTHTRYIYISIYTYLVLCAYNASYCLCCCRRETCQCQAACLGCLS